jgi:hypothetical protein
VFGPTNHDRSLGTIATIAVEVNQSSSHWSAVVENAQGGRWTGVAPFDPRSSFFGSGFPPPHEGADLTPKPTVQSGLCAPDTAPPWRCSPTFDLSRAALTISGRFRPFANGNVFLNLVTQPTRNRPASCPDLPCPPRAGPPPHQPLRRNPRMLRETAPRLTLQSRTAGNGTSFACLSLP